MAGVLHLLTHQLGNSVRSPMMAALCKPAHQVWYTFCERAICVLDKLSLLRAAQGTWCAESLGAVQKVTVASSHKPVAPKDEKDLPHVIVACLGAGRVYTPPHPGESPKAAHSVYMGAVGIPGFGREMSPPCRI